MSVRVRFAPSPTGLLHVGALRTVLYDYLFARHQGGQLILRIEDTDQSRYNADSEREFIETLHWVGIDFDEGPHVGGPYGPYRQSERKGAGIYAPHIAEMLARGHAYKAFDTPEEIEAMRKEQADQKQNVGYFGGKWRDATLEQVAEAESAGLPFVIRQRIPRGVTISAHDFVRGTIDFDSNLLPDPVLIKADGMPTYHFAAMVDDHEMKITHILRGEEWLSTFPVHWLLFDQLGWERPVFVHCPVITGKDGKKLSKRHGATRVLDYGAQGYLKEALKNFIALIGWSPGEDREVMTEAEMIEVFSLERLQPSSGQFDIDKLIWLNGHRIRLMDLESLLDAFLDFARDPYTESFWATFDGETLPGRPPVDRDVLLAQLKRVVEAAEKDRGYVLEALREVQQRVEVLADFGEALEFFLVEEPTMDQKAVEKWFGQQHVRDLFDWILAKIAESRVSTAEHYETVLKGYQTHAGLEKLGPIVHPVRVALTGKTTGPGLFELMSVLGPSRIEQRLQRAMGML